MTTGEPCRRVCCGAQPGAADGPPLQRSPQKPSSQSMKTPVSKLCSPASRGPGTPTPRTAAEAGLSAQALKEIAVGTKSISLIAATRRSRAQDCEGGSGRSSLHPAEEAAPDPKDPKPSVTPETTPTDRKRPQASPGRARSAERKARGKPSPPLTRSVQLVGGQGPGGAGPRGSPRAEEGDSRTDLNKIRVGAGVPSTPGGEENQTAPRPRPCDLVPSS